MVAARPIPERNIVLDTHEELRAAFIDARDAFQQRSQILIENMAFYRGLQWGEADGSNWWPNQEASGEAREVYNYIRAFVNSWVAAVLQSIPNPAAAAAHTDIRSRGRARASHNLVRTFGRRNDILNFEELYRGETSVPIYGGAWYKVYFDPGRGRSVKTPRLYHDPNAGEVQALDVFGHPAFDHSTEGEIAFEFSDVFDTIPDPNARRGSRCRRVFSKKLVPVLDLEADFPEDVFGVSTKGRFGRDENDAGTTERDLVERDRVAGRGTRRSEGLALVVECWEEPSTRYQGGRLLVYSGDVVMALGPLPYVWPWVYRLGPNPVPNAFYAQGLVPDLKSPQRTLNLMTSKQREIGDMVLNPHLFVPRDSDIMLSDVADVPGRIIEYNPGRLPTWLPTPPIPSSLFEMGTQLVSAMKDITGDSGILRGQVPQGLESGRAVAYLEQFQRASQAPHVHLFKLAIKSVLEKMLSLARDFYDDGRLVPMVGKDNQWTLTPFRRDDYDFDIALQIEPFSGVALSKNVRDQMVFDAKAAGMFEDDPAAKRARRALEMNLADDADPYDADEAQRNNAQEENALIAEFGEYAPVIVRVQDDDSIHLDEINAYRISREYREAHPNAQAFADAHAQQHEEALLLKQQRAAYQMSMLAGPNMGTTGGAPPPKPPGAPSPGNGGHGASVSPADENPRNENPAEARNVAVGGSGNIPGNLPANG